MKYEFYAAQTAPAHNGLRGDVPRQMDSPLDFSQVAEPGPFYRFQQEEARREFVGFWRGLFWAVVFSIPMWAVIVLGGLAIFRHK